jgi:uncharacterized Zn finger protein (UPF0148 family)
MLHCPDCGDPLKKTALVCPKCGAEVPLKKAA